MVVFIPVIVSPLFRAIVSPLFVGLKERSSCFDFSNVFNLPYCQSTVFLLLD